VIKKLKTSYETIYSDVVISKPFMILTSLAILFYFTWWLDFTNAGSPILYSLLVVGEIYHVWQAFGYIYTIWDQRRPLSKIISTRRRQPQVDVFITVCGEPAEIVERTIKAATSLRYKNYKVYVLNDGMSRNMPGWKEINEIASKYGAIPITRENNYGAKAGNINHGLRQTSAPFFAVLDADHRPYKDFLLRIMSYFTDDKMAIVQTPQYYANSTNSFLTQAAWEQQELFFGPICRGKNRLNATFWCGTNAVIRRLALESIDGIPEDNIAEDFLASLKMHEKGWKSVYVPKVLAEGLSPHNLGNYVLQQFRWARGSSEIMFKHNPIFKRGLTWAQKIQYLYSSSYYLNGFIILIDALIPIYVLFSGALPVKAGTSDFMLYFFPFIFSTLHLLMLSTENTVTYRAIQLSVSSFYVFIKAVLSTVFGIKAKFNITSKSEESGNFIFLAAPHFLYSALGITAIIYAFIKNGFVPSVLTNASWIIFNIAFFFGFIRAAYPWNLLRARTLSKLKSLGVRYSRGTTISAPSPGLLMNNNTASVVAGSKVDEKGTTYDEERK